MNEDMKIGTKIALEGVKEELIKVRAELKRKGFSSCGGLFGDLQGTLAAYATISLVFCR